MHAVLKVGCTPVGNKSIPNSTVLPANVILERFETKPGGNKYAETCSYPQHYPEWGSLTFVQGTCSCSWFLQLLEAPMTPQRDMPTGTWILVQSSNQVSKDEPVESSSRYIEPGDIWFERLASDCGAHTDGGIHTNLHEFKIIQERSFEKVEKYSQDHLPPH